MSTTVKQTEYRLTTEGINKLKSELDYLINTRRPQIIEQLVEARAQGDLSENADYDAAREAQGRLESRIKEINNILGHAKVIEESNSGTKIVRLGSTVTIKDFSDNEQYTYKIVSAIEADPFKFMISNESPLAKVLSGKKKGITVEVKGIENPYKVEILNIK